MSEAVHILVAQGDSEGRRRTVQRLIAAGWRASEARALAAAIARDPDVVVLLDAPEELAELVERHPDVPAVVVGPDDVGAATAAMQHGAWDYVVARPDLGHLDLLRAVVPRALERRRLLRERNRLREEMDGLAVALQRTADAVLILAAGGRIAFANRALGESFGVPTSALVGRPLAEFARVPGDEHALDDVLAAVEERGRWSGELERRTSGPGAVWEVSLTPLSCDRRVVGIFRDVTEKRALEGLRADFLSMVTHDIKVPLTVILGYTEMLGDPEPPPDQVPLDVVARIREGGEQIHALVCNFLDLSRIEAGRFTIDPRPFDLPAMLAHVLEQHAHAARRKEIALSLDAEAPLVIVADEGQIERAVTNLLANAVKYTAKGGRVVLAARRDGDRVVVTCADTGRGIPPAELPHLFERYRRVREAERTEGTGLGLFIAKTIVDAHGGSIGVDSTPGVGSVFTVALPSAPQ